MLVTLTNRGAAVERVELADPRYLDIDPEHRFGYLGELAPVADKAAKGCRVQVVGNGTPAAIGGVRVGDVIRDLHGEKTATPADLFKALQGTESDQSVTLTVQRGAAVKKLTVVLGRRPLEVIRPEFNTDPIEQDAAAKHDPLSFLMTLARSTTTKSPPTPIASMARFTGSRCDRAIGRESRSIKTRLNSPGGCPSGSCGS